MCDPKFIDVSTTRHSSDAEVRVEVEKVWEEFWLPIFMRDPLVEPHIPPYSPFLEQLKRELFDAHNLMHSLSVIYCEISGSIVSKPLTKPEVVVELAQEHFYDWRDRDWHEFLERLCEERKDNGLMISFEELIEKAKAEFPVRD